MCFLWSSAELELGVCLKKEPGCTVTSDYIKACGSRWRERGSPLNTPLTPQCFLSLLLLSPFQALTGQCRTSYLRLCISTLLGLENAQDLYSRAGCLGAALPQTPPLTGPLQAAVLPPTHWRSVGACSPWDGWAEPHSVANGKTLSPGLVKGAEEARVGAQRVLMVMVSSDSTNIYQAPHCEPDPLANSVPE